MSRIYIALTDDGIVNAAAVEEHMRKEDWHEVMSWVRRGNTVRLIDAESVTLGEKWPLPPRPKRMVERFSSGLSQIGHSGDKTRTVYSDYDIPQGTPVMITWKEEK
jgi:hypothetical protein